MPEIGDPLLEDALDRFPLVVELTERALPNHTTDLIPLAEDLRRRGARIALDDVGTDPRSLALMPFLRPDVIKLDLQLMQDSPSREIAEVVHAVNAEAERTGALILAEGIETEEHLRRALALGASYGQGWLFGRPGELRPDHRARRGRGDLPAAAQRGDDAGPRAHPVRDRRREAAAAAAPTRCCWPSSSRSIERQTANQASSAVVISSFQRGRVLQPRRRPATTPSWPRTRRSSRRSASSMEAEPAPGVRGVALDPEEPLRGEWDVIVLGPHFGAAIVARPGRRAPPRRASASFDFALTHDRDLVTEAARAMMRRLRQPRRCGPSRKKSASRASSSETFRSRPRRVSWTAAAPARAQPGSTLRRLGAQQRRAGRG